LMRVGRMEGAERRRLGLLNNSGKQGSSIKVELSQGTERNSILAKDEAATTPATAKVSQQVDEKAADSDHGDTDDGYQPRQLGNQAGGAKPGKEAGEGTAAQNTEWISLAGEAQKQLQECSRNRRQASATATSVDGGTSCRGATASRRSAGPEDNNTDNWQAELLHDVDEDSLRKT
jgi:hypothetical protein